MDRRFKFSLVVLALATFLLSVSTAWCGRIVLVNNSHDYVKLTFSIYCAGASGPETIDAYAQNSYVYDDVLCSISKASWVDICPAMKDYSGHVMGADCSKRKSRELGYTVQGPWLPHRKFTVTYDSFEDIKVEEK